MAFDAFLRLDGIQGDSNDDAHKDEIEVVAFNWAVTRPKKKKELQPLVIYKRVDKATPQLSMVTCGGGSIASARLDVVRSADRQSFFQLVLANVVIVGLEIEGVADGESGTPSEKLSLAYEAITVRSLGASGTGTPQNPTEGTCFK
jgi:type VI secretion system secreted protein Hcp